MNQYPPKWNKILSLSDLDEVIESSKLKPVLIYKHGPSSRESLEKKIELESNWSFSDEEIDLFLIDDSISKDVSTEVSDIAGISNDFPQIILFADGVTMYDESQEMISVKKIKLALKIVNRTFRWMESRI